MLLIMMCAFMHTWSVQEGILTAKLNDVLPGVHNAKAEECTTPAPYMRQNIEINIGVGGLHGNQGY